MSDLVYGYKATRDDMSCRGYQFEIGETHTVDGEVRICENGFHFCKKLTDVFKYYNALTFGKVRVFKIVASGQIIDGDNKSVCENIQFIEEITIQQLMADYSDNADVRMLAALNHYLLDTLVTDNHHVVRIIVAEQGYGLDVLSHDDHPYVRKAALKMLSNK